MSELLGLKMTGIDFIGAHYLGEEQLDSVCPVEEIEYHLAHVRSIRAVDFFAVDGYELAAFVIKGVPLHAVLYAVKKSQCKSVNGYAISPVFEWQVFSPQNHVAAHGRRTEQPAEKASVFGHGLDLLAAPHRLVHVDKANPRLVQPLVAVGEIALFQVE